MEVDKVTANKTRIKFEGPNGSLFTVEHNKGQLTFDTQPDAFIALDDHEGEGAWYMDVISARDLHNWLTTLLIENDPSRN